MTAGSGSVSSELPKLESFATLPSGDGRDSKGTGVMVQEAIRKAETLIEALGYIREFRHKITVIKVGGSVMEHTDSLDALMQDVVFMETVGLRPIIVHGGGKAISEAMRAADIQPRFLRGRRYTDEKTMEIVADVLTGTINPDLVARIERLQGLARGLHYRGANCLVGRRLTLSEAGEEIDLGRVGEVIRLDEERLRKLLQAGIIPVIPCVVLDEEGGLLNVNADTAAAAVARHLKAEKLIFVSDTPGILADASDESTLLRHLDAGECQRLIHEGTIGSGMIPKVEACLQSLRAGVGKTHMVDGRIRHSILLEIYTDSGVGTEIVL